VIGPGPAAEHLTLHDGVPATDTINGTATVHVTSTFADPIGTDCPNSTVDYWLSTEDDPSLFRITVTYPDISNGDTSQILTKYTFTWSNFNEGFNIKPPAQWVEPSNP
jgi:hypothetical protein